MGERSDVHPGGECAESEVTRSNPPAVPHEPRCRGQRADVVGRDGALPPRAVESFSCMFRSPRKPDSFAISSATRTDDRE